MMYLAVIMLAFIGLGNPLPMPQTGPPTRQSPIQVIGLPSKASFRVGEPILIDVIVRNGFAHPIMVPNTASSPNQYADETVGVELPDIYRLPTIGQIWQGRPRRSPPPFARQAEGSISVAPGGEFRKTIDASKWMVAGGWSAGQYQARVRVDTIVVDETSWMWVQSDPFEFSVVPASTNLEH